MKFYRRTPTVMFPAMLFLIYFSLPSYASNLTEYKIDKGKEAVKQGNISQAVEDFKKALLIDPANRDAIYELEKLGFHRNDIMSKEAKTESLMRHIGEYKQRVADLEDHKAHIEAKLAALQSKSHTLSEMNKAKDFERDLLQEKIHLLTRNMTKFERAEFQSYVDGLQERKIELANKPAMSFAEKETRLKAIKHKFERMSVEAPVYEKKLVSLSKQYHTVSQNTFNYKPGEDHALQVLEDYIYFKKQMYDQLNGKDAAKAEALTGHEQMMLSKIEELLALHESVGKYIKFMESRNAVIRRNNSLLASLRNDMAIAQYDSTKPDAMNKAIKIHLTGVEEDLTSIQKGIDQAKKSN